METTLDDNLREVLDHEMWSPIPIIQVDVDALTSLRVPDDAIGGRVWLEVSKQGQVVGVAETVADADGTISTAKLEEVTAPFWSIPVIARAPIDEALLPRASVIVPTLCRDLERLTRTVNTLLAQEYPDFEIILVDNRTPPFEYPMPYFEDPRVRVVEETRRGASAARNRGITQSTGEFVAFTDDDVVVERRWLRELGRRFLSNPEIDGIGGLVLPLELQTQPQLWFEEYFGGFTQSFSSELLSIELMKDDKLFPYSTGRFGAGCNMAFRRSVLDEKGGFDPLLGIGTVARGGEDLAIFLKQVLSGGTTAFEPRAVVRHQHRQTEHDFFSQVFGYGTGLTAMYTSLVLSDPRHLFRMLPKLRAAYRILAKPREERSPSSVPSYPRRAYTQHILGLLYGPIAYVRSVARSIFSK